MVSSKKKHKMFRPHAYQRRVLDLMEENGKYGLFLEPGLGKTATALEDFRRRRDSLDAVRALIVAPLPTCSNVWPPEIAKWTQFRDFTYVVLHGKTRTVEAANGVEICIINPEGLPWMVENYRDIEGFGAVYVDESTMFKKASRKRTKNLFKLCHKLKGGISYRFILSGSPAPNGHEDLFGQMGLLDPEILGRSLTAFHEKFHYRPRRTSWGVEWEETDKTQAAIEAAVKPHAIYLKATDHIDMPDLVEVKRIVELPPPVMKMYRDLKQEMFTEFDSGSVVGVNPGVLSAKCRQVANGAVYLSELGEAAEEETSRIEYIHTKKAESLGDLFEDLETPLLVGYEFKHDLTVIKAYMKDRFNIRVPWIGGGTSSEDTKRYIQEWTEGDIPILAINPSKAAHGLNLQSGGHHMCWYSIPWNLEHYIQLNARLWRQGQREGVFIHHIIAKDTIDELVWRALGKKSTSQRSLLLALMKREKGIS